MMKLILLFTLLVAVASLLMNILMWIKIGNISDKRKELKDEFIKFQKDITYSLENCKQRIESLLYKKKQLEYAPTQNIQLPVQQPVGNTIQKPAQQPAQQIGKGKHNKHGKKHDNGGNKLQQPVVIKTIYLGINSDDFFFDNVVDVQKSATSKFIGSLTSDTEGTFIPIDVERIRSANVAASVKQQGLISLKDAHTLNVVAPGVIRKEEDGWLIQSPVVVEFNK